MVDAGPSGTRAAGPAVPGSFTDLARRFGRSREEASAPYIPICNLISGSRGRLERSEQALPLHDHVTRNATIGSIVIARRAGK